jgi:hypothetical protein
LLHRHSGGHIKSLQVARVVASRAEAKLGELSNDVVSGEFDTWGVDAASGKFF